MRVKAERDKLAKENAKLKGEIAALIAALKIRIGL